MFSYLEFEAVGWGLLGGAFFILGLWHTAKGICDQRRSLLSYAFKFGSIAAIVLGMYRSEGLWQAILPSFLASALLFLGAALLARRKGLG